MFPFGHFFNVMFLWLMSESHIETVTVQWTINSTEKAQETIILEAQNSLRMVQPTCNSFFHVIGNADVI